MKRIVVVVDFANIERSASDSGYVLDYLDLLKYLASERDGRFLVEAFCFFPIDPRSPHAKDKVVEELAMDGYLVRSKVGAFAGDTYKCNFDVEIAMELVRISQEMKPDIVVLCSGDGDFLPVVDFLRTRGIRVEVAAFLGSTARNLILGASSFIDLEVYLSESNQEPASEMPQPGLNPT